MMQGVHRLTPSELEAAFPVITALESSVKIIAQMKIMVGLYEFFLYVLKNNEGELTLLSKPLFVLKNDEIYSFVGLDEFLKIYQEIFKKGMFSQILIPIAEIGGYPLSSQPSRHFILLCIDAKQQAVVYDSNPSYHIRTTRDADIWQILHDNQISYEKTSYIFFSAPHREHVATQVLFDNQSCGYHVTHFVRLKTRDPSRDIDYAYASESFQETITQMEKIFQTNTQSRHPYCMPFTLHEPRVTQYRTADTYFFCEEIESEDCFGDHLREWAIDKNKLITTFLPEEVVSFAESEKNIIYHFDIVSSTSESFPQVKKESEIVVREEYCGEQNTSTTGNITLE